MRIQDLTDLTTLADTDLVVVDDYQSAGVYTTKKMTVANLKSQLGLPKYIIAVNLSQSGTSAPTITEVFNNSGVTVTTTYQSQGEYTLELSSAIMTSNKTIVTATTGVLNPYILGITKQNDLYITISTYNASGTGVNNQLYNTSIKIEIYE